MNETLYRITLASADRIEDIESFVIATMTKLYPLGDFNPEPDDLKRFKEIYEKPADACFYIAENASGAVVGSAAVRPYDGRFTFLNGKLRMDLICEMTKFYIDESCRRQGIGSALYAHTEAFARKAGYLESYLHTSLYLPGGYTFWRANGFEEKVWESDQIVHMSKYLNRIP
jgi:GNAT superfamily N-acetyltransferase